MTDKKTEALKLALEFVSPGGGYVPAIPAPQPSKPWVGLTDEEAQAAFARHNCTISKDLAGILARAIEQRLKEKNT